MSYKKFTFSNLEEKFGIKQTKKQLFVEAIAPIQASSWLLETLKINLKKPLLSEKAIGEGIIYPILTELTLQNADRIELFSGVNMVGDKKQGLNGECDFILAKAPHSAELQAPLVSITEAKKGDIDDPKSLAQCTAQLIGARFFNEKAKKPNPILYGAVSSGREWLFLKLEEKTIFIDTDTYFIVNLTELLGILQHIVNFYIVEKTN